MREHARVHLESLALSVARCRHLDAAARDSTHPCHDVVSCQSGPPETRQVPEGWAGALETAKVATLSSNPSISEAGPGQPPGIVERYPRASWPNEDITNFALNRFLDGGFATEEGRSLRDDGDWTAPVAFWLGVRRLMGELLEGKPSPSRDYVMTEVVHCKSKDERGVAKAAGTCADEHLDAIFVACPAPVILVVGSRARDLIKPRLSLPPGFGTKATVGVDEVVNCVTRTVSGRERLVIYIWHPSGMTAPQRLAKAYPTLLPLIRRVAAGLEPVPSRSV